MRELHTTKFNMVAKLLEGAVSNIDPDWRQKTTEQQDRIFGSANRFMIAHWDKLLDDDLKASSKRATLTKAKQAIIALGDNPDFCPKF